MADNHRVMQYCPIPAYNFLSEKPLGSYRFRAAFGGRGSAKSWEFANAAIYHSLPIEGFRLTFLREIQKNLEESSFELVRSRLRHYGLLSELGFSYYREVKGGFQGKNGQKIMFTGLWKGGKPEGIKSLEGVHLTVLEEAQETSQKSLDILLPTILRTPISELWAIWNPRLEIDPVDVFFRGPVKPTKAICRRLNHNRNPHFPEALAELRTLDYKKDEQRAIWIWEGGYMPAVQNSIWTKLSLATATNKGRGAVQLRNWSRVVVGVDPSGGGDAVGIVAVADLGLAGCIVLEDATVSFEGVETPEARTLYWSNKVIEVARRWEADAIVAEKNFGGDMVHSVICNAMNSDESYRVVMVTASKGKHIRAEPVAALYDQGLVAHAEPFPLLQSEMLMTNPLGYQGSTSPNRMDALVWAITDLKLGDHGYSLEGMERAL